MSDIESILSPPKEHRRHVVSVLLHDYFHRHVFNEVIGEKQWDRFESRMEKNVDDTCDLLERFHIKATFFTLGWIGEKRPEIIKKLVAKGHEIASAGYEICSVKELGPDRFRQDLRRARHALEGAGSNRIVGYRCAYHWIGDSELWALNILAEEGYHYDASYRPPFWTLSSNGICRFAREIPTPAGNIWEFPVSTSRHLGMNIPVSGGSYLRQFPKSLMFGAFRRWCEENHAPFVLYFHPWELDSEQPRINSLSNISKLRQYRNLGHILKLLPVYFEAGKFQSISQYLDIPLQYPDGQLPKISEDFLPYPVQKDSGEGVKEITIIIPMFNETSSLFYLKRTLDELVKEAKSKYKIKFIFVDDGSTDHTYEELVKFFGSREECKILRHTTNQGIAGSLSTGFQAANTEIVCSMDADCSYDPLELMKMIPLLEDGVDLVTASPYHRDGAVRNVPRWRLFLSKSLSRLYHLLLRHKLATYTSCLRVYRKSSVMSLDIRNTGFLGIAELIAKLDIHGGTIREYPAVLESRIFGQSKMQVLQTILGHLRLILIVLNYRRKFAKNDNSLPSHPKKIWIDLDNSPHVPFFKPIIDELERRGYETFITAREGFQVRGLAERFNLRCKVIGHHHGKYKIKKGIGLLYRAAQMIPSILKEKPVLALSHGSRAQLIAAKMLGIPSVLIFDYEFAKGIPLVKPSWGIAPEVIPMTEFRLEKDSILRYPGIKEDVYIPGFKPDPSIMDELGLNHNKLVIIVRPPATEAHYYTPKSEVLFELAMEFLGKIPDAQLVLLPRNEKQKRFISEKWPTFFSNGKIIIPNHVIDGLNLIWHSDLVISGGGTMNREAAALGVPVYSIFKGKIGAVDRYLSAKGRLILIENGDELVSKVILAHRDKTYKPQDSNNLTLQKIVSHLVNIIERKSP